MIKKKSNRYSKSLFRQQEIFSIRKLSLGVASVLLGSFLVRLPDSFFLESKVMAVNK
ncbi:YSIRK-type signal peptide-containing protein [Streptococcus suis]|uniref:YSIRK-type signal peptide-containing protein n=1 Tax=Streptococcus suis TaxID=1307 RepID=UPI000CF6DA5A|nr:YSIRK-type signal peptide-containing protein [Streptococcus suis]